MQPITLTTFQQILQPLNVKFDIIMNKLILGILVFFAFNCNSKKATKEIIFIEEELSFANDAYAEVGKLKLSEYRFFQNPISELLPEKNVFPYEMNSPLFTDYAFKKRLFFIPEGKTVTYQEKEILAFPIGTVLIKNFYYEEDQLSKGNSMIIETRLLIHEESGWVALPYIWNPEQTEAYLEITGGKQEVSLKDKGKFNYAIPTMAECKSCHEINGAIAPIGPSARQLNKTIHGKNQLLTYSEAGILNGLPEISSVDKLAVWDDQSSGSLDDRSRAYLEINCGHCHRPEGPGKNSGLDLTINAASDHALGIYKGPVAAGAGSGGLNYDIVPGQPEASILTFRMESNDPGTMMPELGRKLVHTEGVELIKKWIKSMR